MSGIDKSWMLIRNHNSAEYRQGVKDFLDFAFGNVELDNSQIWCPCKVCNRVRLRNRLDCEADLIIHGIDQNYTHWYSHGEKLDSVHNPENEENDTEVDDMEGMIHGIQGQGGMDNFGEEEPNVEASKFYKLLKDAEQALYPGCKKFSKLSFIIKLLHIKCLNGWSNRSFNMLLELLKEALPPGEMLPSSYYEAKKTMKDLGLGYEKIDSCINDCLLYRKQHEHATACHVCGVSRYKHAEEDSNLTSREHSKTPAKVLFYFPIKDRLRRLYMSSKTASHMRWHSEGRPNASDGVMRHPADSPAWKTFDVTHPSFAADPRNVRLGLAADGFNPFGNMSVSYSIWPVVLVPYNLPPWMCMKQPYSMLSLLIPGPKSPGNDIDIYLQPLIEELKELWEVGVDTYDAYLKQNFQMHAAILWTISDFPAYANLSGWSTSGKMACPTCSEDTCSIRLKNGKKFCYMGHRRFLPINHSWRNNKNSFNGEKELRAPPCKLGGDDVLCQLSQLQPVILGKSGKSGKKRSQEKHIQVGNWKKKSIFFELPYWRTLLLRHNLDVMHIEKNVCDSVIGTLLDIDGKSKDNLNSRLDLQEMGIRRQLHPIQRQDKWLLPVACYTMSLDEKKSLCTFLKQVKAPDGYSSNISRCVHENGRRISGLKSHDYHVLMQQLLSPAIRGTMDEQVANALIELSNFFRQLCSKVLRQKDLDDIEGNIAITLCKLEMIFPPSFFDVMMHLPIHLAEEAKIAGPVQYRWMYPIERYLRKLKSYVRNKSRPEGSIAEGYLAEECLTFCSRYLEGIDTRFNQLERNYDGGPVTFDGGPSIFAQAGRPLRRSSDIYLLNDKELHEAHLYVLRQCNEVYDFIGEHIEVVNKVSGRSVQKRHESEFPSWFEKRALELYDAHNPSMNEDLYCLACGPRKEATSYKGYVINGFRFCTERSEKLKKTHNSGVVVNAVSDTSNIDYYGVLTDILELHYLGGKRVVLFKCIWWDVHNPNGIKKDKHGFVSVNTARVLDCEPFILACQAEQVFYVPDNISQGWSIVMRNQPRDYYDMANGDSDVVRDDLEAFQQIETLGSCDAACATNDNDDVIRWSRSKEYISVPMGDIRNDVMAEDVNDVMAEV